MRVGVIGTGHVGLVTCVSFAALGYEVVGVDSDDEKIARLRSGISPFFEPGLEELLLQGMVEGRLAFSNEISQAVAGADVVFICVGTPPRATGEANLVAVEKAAREAARHATGRTVVVEKSTVPAGTAIRLRRALQQERPDSAHELEIASNPEFLREGMAVQDSLNPDRILVGAESQWAFQVMRRVYQPLIKKGCRFIETDIATAELAKHACNAFLALKVSFANALSRICELSGADVTAVADVMGADARIGRAFLNAGLGYGGSCFPKDLAAFERFSHNLGYDFSLLREISKINGEAVEAALSKVKEAIWNLEGKRITLLGLSFKPDTDDIRFAPALKLAQQLLAEGASIVGYDPQALANARAEMPQLEVAHNPYDAAAGSHCLVVCTEWEEFRSLDLSRLRRLMSDPVIVDGRNLFDPQVVRKAGFTYYPTGRPPVIQEVWGVSHA